MLSAGLDWADTNHDVIDISDAGRQVASKQVAYTKAGLETLIGLLTEITGQQNKDQLTGLSETSRGPLITALLQIGFIVSPVPPKIVGRRRGVA